MRIVIETDASVAEAFLNRTVQAVAQHAESQGYVADVQNRPLQGEIRISVSKTDWAVLSRDAKKLTKIAADAGVDLRSLLFDAGVIGKVKFGKGK